MFIGWEGLVRNMFHLPNVKSKVAARMRENWVMVIAFEVQILKKKKGNPESKNVVT